MKYHILVVDDDKRIRLLLKEYLISNGFFVSSAANTNEARKALNYFDIDLIVLDIMMPGESGVSLTKAIRENSKTPIILLSAMSDTRDKIEGLEKGADDYVVKPFEPRELLLRINKILEKMPKINTREVKFGNNIFDLEKLELSQNDQVIPLTSTESKLLKIFCSKIGTVLSREKIAEFFEDINTRTIDVQITRLRNKIEPTPKIPIFLKTIRGEGYVFYNE